MKKIVLVNVLLALVGSATSLLAATEQYTLDPAHSYVLWHANHFGFSNPSGKWMVEGSLDFDKNNFQNSKINVKIPVNKLVTAIADLDKHLKAKLFFDTQQFPLATFVSDKIEKSSDKSMKIMGTLTIKGISKPVTLNAIINKIGVNPITEKETIGFSGHTQINRSEFGITTLLPDISDEVKIDIEGEAFLNKTSK
jgi:polyisoprenoid-binding protein YceI